MRQPGRSYKNPKQSKPNDRSKCSHFQTCGAPLCPLDNESKKHGIWYPGEAICKQQIAPRWVKKQRIIARALKVGKGQEAVGKTGFFTVRSLRAMRGERFGWDRGSWKIAMRNNKTCLLWPEKPLANGKSHELTQPPL